MIYITSREAFQDVENLTASNILCDTMICFSLLSCTEYGTLQSTDVATETLACSVGDAVNANLIGLYGREAVSARELR